MSDQPTSIEIVELANEYRVLQRRLEARSQQFQSLLAMNAEAGDFPAADFDGLRNRRYLVEFNFKPDENLPFGEFAAQGQLTQELSVQVESGTIFRCAYVESFVKAVGVAADPFSGEDVTVQATLSWSARLRNFDFFWRIRDTGSDREWCNRPQPSLMLGGGYWGPLWLPRRNILGGGTNIYVQINPFLIQPVPGAGTFFQNGEVLQYTLQVSFVGHDVPDRSAL